MTTGHRARAITLPVRLFASYLVVIAVGALAAYLTVWVLTPRLFDHRMGAMSTHGVAGMMRGTGAAQTRSAVVSAVNTALLVAVGVSALVAGAVAAFVTGRLLAPLDAVRAATRRIAAGDYATPVPEPAEPELAALAADVTSLGRTLADTEGRRTRLLGDVAHEMRTPLTALDGYVEALIDGVLPADVEHLQAMAEEIHRLHRLADDLSTLSRAEEDRIELHPVPADLAQLASSACERLRPQYDDAGVQLVVHTDGAVPGHVDPDRITQVLTNLLGNALVATPAGGVVTVTATSRGTQADVEVSDTGVGLTAEDLERVFERFYRAPGATHRSSGSGVGLTISRRLARAHGGELSATSPGPGQGATFVLRLPAR